MKNYFILAAAALFTAGCTQSELEEAPSGQKGIKFSNLNNKVTRAANDGNADYQVYAKSSSVTATSWFIDDVIGGTDNIPVSGKIYHWPNTGNLDFYAWAPYSVLATAGTFPGLSIGYTVPAAANQDFTIAKPIIGINSSTNSSKVAFEFAHMLAKVSITTELSQNLLDAGYEIDVDNIVASLKVNSTGGSIDPTSTTGFSWTSPNTVSASYSGALSYMIMPQSSVDCTVQVTGGVVITKGGVEIYSGGLQPYTIAATNIAGDNFVMGRHYLLKLIIDDDSNGGTDPENPEPIFNIIVFEAAVDNWVEVNPDPLPQP